MNSEFPHSSSVGNSRGHWSQWGPLLGSPLFFILPMSQTFFISCLSSPLMWPLLKNLKKVAISKHPEPLGKCDKSAIYHAVKGHAAHGKRWPRALWGMKWETLLWSLLCFDQGSAHSGETAGSSHDFIAHAWGRETPLSFFLPELSMGSLEHINRTSSQKGQLLFLFQIIDSSHFIAAN